MKKIRFAGLLLLAPLTLLSACGGGVQTLTFHPNWYKNTRLSDQHIQGTLETLEYEVTFEGAPKNGYSVNYSNGTYTTELRSDILEREDGSSVTGYVYTTSLTVDVSFSLNGQKSETFTDTVTSEVEFLPAGSRLQPLRSEKTVISHSPVETPVALIEGGAWNVFNYTYTVEYSDDLTKATTVYAAEDKTAVTTEYNLNGGGTFLDNEQILFALRGLDLSAALSFRSINPVRETRKAASLTTTTPTEVTENISFEKDGETVAEAVNAYSLILYYNDGTGQQTLVYAATSSASTNTYRNVLLRAERPILHSLGTMKYTLKKANFTIN